MFEYLIKLYLQRKEKKKKFYLWFQFIFNFFAFFNKLIFFLVFFYFNFCFLYILRWFSFAIILIFLVIDSVCFRAYPKNLVILLLSIWQKNLRFFSLSLIFRFHIHWSFLFLFVSTFNWNYEHFAYRSPGNGGDFFAVVTYN